MDKDHDEYLRQLLRIRDDLQAYCLSLVRSWADADELFQRTAVVLWERFGDFDPERAFAPWARGIARNLALKHFRERRRLVQMDQSALDAIDCAFEADDDQGADELAALEACLSQLPAPSRRLLAWRYGESRPIGRIAQALNRSVAAVTKQLSRLRGALQECIVQRLRADGAP
ncbi:MAG: sigma-70 family RNA polymerase sigma factor [Planctomycetota bacterium]|nr:sigma-70 family RNA polymerase sigma factor [Planctomycetota bacterium]